MIISRTPFRISFAGGGSDLKEYYSHGYGAVTSTAIDKYMYVSVNKRFDGTIRLSYTKTEIVGNVDEIKHELVREAMKKTGVTSGVEITTMADIPAGTGLGSSSSLTVGVLNALYAYKGKRVSAEQLAKEASEIEIDIINEPIGKQDQYAAAYGGLNHIRFNPDESVILSPIVMADKFKQELNENIMLFYTNISRSAGSILQEQKQNMQKADKRETLSKMVKIAEDIKDALSNDDLTTFGKLLDNGWQYKRQLASKITNPEIDAYYNKAIEAGALGGKLSGAGGGGFLMLYCEKAKQQKVTDALSNLRRFDVSFDESGSKIIFEGG